MKTISILLISAASLFLSSCASDNMNAQDMQGMDHSQMQNMTPEEHARMKM